MRKCALWKALALLLAAVALAAGYLCVNAFFFLMRIDLYDLEMQDFQTRIHSFRADTLAGELADRYAMRNLSWLPPDMLRDFLIDYSDDTLSQNAALYEGCWYYTLQDSYGNILESTLPQGGIRGREYETVCTGEYLQEVPAATSGDIVTYTAGGVTRYYAYTRSPEYRITIYTTDGAVTAAYGLPLTILESLYQFRYTFILGIAVSGLLFLGCIIFLCFAAGHSKKREQLQPGGLNRIPLDLYAVGAFLSGFWLLWCVDHLALTENIGWYSSNRVHYELLVNEIVASVFSGALGLVIAAFLFALAAQLKSSDRFWWRNSILCRLLRLTGKILGYILRFLLRGLRWLLELFRMLPLIWQWLLTGSGMLLLLFLGLSSGVVQIFALCLLLCLLVLLYGSWAFGCLLRGAEQMAQGSLQSKVPEQYLIGAFKTFAVRLNTLSGAVEEAANARMRSERMKTELITNVSHDIKTPLTSIISYTELLRSAQSPEQQAEYLDILDKQSIRLKKLIEDLTELSKASSGNLQADIAPLNAGEALTQALGEFADKLDFSQLQLCPQIGDAPIMILADGRLFWRVMANLMSNTVKYAMAGTRVYVKLEQDGSYARITVKNISREPLNIPAAELMERFVRGDASRNTDGSGLGLSIAASLMEVQQGHLFINIDGDLFSATVEFPLAACNNS